MPQVDADGRRGGVGYAAGRKRNAFHLVIRIYSVKPVDALFGLLYDVQADLAATGICR